MYFASTPSPPDPKSDSIKHERVTWVITTEGATDVKLVDLSPEPLVAIELLSSSATQVAFSLSAKGRGQTTLRAKGSVEGKEVFIDRRLWIGYFMSLPDVDETSNLFMAESQQTRDTPATEAQPYPLMWSPTGKCYVLNAEHTVLKVEPYITKYWSSGDPEAAERDPLYPGDYGDVVYQLTAAMPQSSLPTTRDWVWSLARASWQNISTPDPLKNVIQAMRRNHAVVAWVPPEVTFPSSGGAAPGVFSTSVTCYVLDTYQLKHLPHFDPTKPQHFPLQRIEPARS